ncbi:peptidase domain-containing ABC transporter [Atopobacter sp. AH10]|uniref:peptidase domain-containing ABC transporter n=1 Tax=Atopobacter sp. AH10 TaxID=2315861 RepID=UPI001314D9F3|nr:peptidase domain-containing ABC transporter [Atopobacter sp. AH10]
MRKSFRGVMQHDACDCGAACLTSIINYFGNSVPLFEIREKLKVDKTGSSLYAIGLVAKSYGLCPTALNGRWDELFDELQARRIQLPFIAHFLNRHSKGHFVVVYKYSARTISIFDPGEGHLVLSLEEFQQRWTGAIMTFSKTDTFQDQKKSYPKYTQLIQELVSEEKSFVYTTIYSLIIAGISIIGAFFYKDVIDRIILRQGAMTTFSGIVGRLISNMEALLFAVIGLYIFQLVISLLNGLVLAKMSERLNDKMMNLFFNHMIRLPLEYRDRTESGSVLSRFHHMMEIQNQGVNSLLSILLDGILSLVAVVILWSISPVLFVLVLSMMLLYIGITVAFIQPLKRANRGIQREYSDQLTLVNETLSGLGTIKLQAGEERFSQAFRSKTREVSKGIFKILNLQSVLNALIVLVESIGTLIIIWIGSKLVIFKALSLGQLVAFSSLTSFFTMPVKELMNTFLGLQHTLIAVDRVTDILNTEKEYSTIQADETFQKQLTRVDVKDLTYHYKLGHKSLDKLSLKLERGSIVGLIGRNGSGKTTLLKVLASLLQVDHGLITYEGIKLSKENLASIRRKIAYVGQESFVFEGSLRDNLTLGTSGQATEEEMHRLCREFGLFQLTKKGNGLDYLLLENGDNLSSGQQQKIGLVRALLKKPEILLLDEATSHLDKASLRQVVSYLDRIKKDTIILMACHEADALTGADRLLVMDKGKIIYDGTNDHKKWISLEDQQEEMENVEKELVKRENVAKELVEMENIEQELVERESIEQECV